jgi:4-diphosphocytidyl-2-C-methyl-D-erythritol kinase
VDLNGLWLYLFQPEGGISTASAYRSVRVEEPAVRLSDLIALPAEQWSDKIFNAFQDHAISQIPAIGRILEFLEDKKAIYSSLTGSGSAVYGLFSGEISIPADLSDYLIWKELLT